MKILVTGSEGLLGRAVVSRLAGQHEVRGVDLADGDLTHRDPVRRICDEFGPDRILHCAAWTDVDAAETRFEEARAINATATGHLADWCAAHDAGLTYVSTDYVFRGARLGGGYDEDAGRDPLNRYGQTKAEGEEIVERLGGGGQIVRTSWLFGDGPIHFPRTILRLLSERESLSVVDDQEGCPTYAGDLAEVLAFLADHGAGGIFHATNAGSCTWYELAREVARQSGQDPDRIRPCGSGEYPRPAARPECSVLRSRNLEELGCPPRPPWREALARYLELLRSGQVRYP